MALRGTSREHTFLPSMAIDGKRLCQGGQAKIGYRLRREKQWCQEFLSRTPFQPFVPKSMSEYTVKRRRTITLAFNQNYQKSEVPIVMRFVWFKDTDSVASRFCFGLFNKTKL